MFDPKLILLLFAFTATTLAATDNRVICYYDSRAYFREGTYVKLINIFFFVLIIKFCIMNAIL